MSDEQRTSSKCLSSVPADGDPLPDVGSASVFHNQAVLVAVPGNLGALLSGHSFRHLQGNSKTSGTDNAQVSTRVPGKTPQPWGNRYKELFPVSLPQIIVLNSAPWGRATSARAASVHWCEALPSCWQPARCTWYRAGGITKDIPGMKHACLRPLEILRSLV